MKIFQVFLKDLEDGENFSRYFRAEDIEKAEELCLSRFDTATLVILEVVEVQA